MTDRNIYDHVKPGGYFKIQEIGKYQAVQVNQEVEAYGLRLCTQVLGWGEDPSKISQAMVKKQLREKSLHAYVKE
jgi:hypothetical protein